MEFGKALRKVRYQAPLLCTNTVIRADKIHFEPALVPIIVEKALKGTKWSEVVHLTKARSMATFTSGHLKDRPALTCNRAGRGEVWYLATHLDDTDLSSILHPLMAKLDLQAPLKTPPHVEVSLREKGRKRFLLLINHNEKTVRFELGKLFGRDLLTGKIGKGTFSLQAGGVSVLELN